MSKTTKDFGKFLDELLESDQELKAEVDKERLNAVIADLIYRERKKARLTQQQLAERVGTHQSVIARMEDADYGGHSLSMLWKIADSLGYRLKLDFEEIEQAEIYIGKPQWVGGTASQWKPKSMSFPEGLRLWSNEAA